MMEEAHSNLCKSLSEILNDKTKLSMLPYFIQYMEEVKAIHLVQFWFSVEAFRTAATTLMAKPDVILAGYYNNSCSSNNSNTEGCCSCDSGHKPVAMPPSLPRKLVHDNMEDIPREKKVIQSKYHWETSSFMAQRSLCVKSDAIDIYATYISLNAINNVSISDSLRQHIEVKISPEDGVVKKDCFDEAQTVVFTEMETRYHPQFCRSRFLSKYQLEYISGGHLVMADILLNNNALFYFMEFMESQNASVLLHFWSTVENYKAHYKSGINVNSEEVFNDAMIIYNRYLSLLAHDRIDVEDVVRISVENKICGEEGVSLDAFNVPQYLIYDRMNEEYYPLFLQSDQYSKYISELLYMMEPVRSDHHHTVTTQQFIHTQQQAMATAGSSCKQQVLDELDDPSELWRRPHSILRFGYVTKYGQFVSEAEPDPCHKSHQGYKRRSLSTILGREDHSLAKLEMAREQAVKIIQQILTLTKPPSTHVT